MVEQNMTAARRAVGDQSVVLSWEEATSPPWWVVDHLRPSLLISALSSVQCPSRRSSASVTQQIKIVTFSRANNDSGSPILVDNGLLSLTCLVQAK